MFTQPCLIRKNTVELINKLENLGLKPMNSGGTTLDSHNYDGKGNHRKIEEGKAIITYYSGHYGVIYDIDYVAKRNRIDCGYNENLFLALAALRDDSDYMQLFVLDEDIPNHKKGTFILNVRQHWYCGGEREYKLNDKNALGHKATVDELIKHFK